MSDSVFENAQTIVEHYWPIHEDMSASYHLELIGDKKNRNVIRINLIVTVLIALLFAKQIIYYLN